MYPAEIVIPMKAELTDNGFEEMNTPTDVDNSLETEGTTLVMVNSVCGCAAGAARPGVLMAVHNSNKRPDNLKTVFAGFDIDAVKKMREDKLSNIYVLQNINIITMHHIFSKIDKRSLENND